MSLPDLGVAWEVTFGRTVCQFVRHFLLCAAAVAEDVLEGNRVALGNGEQYGLDFVVERVSLCQGARMQGSGRTLAVRGHENFFVPPLGFFE